MVSLFVRVTTILAGVALHAHCAEPFLQKQPERSSETLLADLESVFGHDSLNYRLPKLEARLGPIFLSLPKDDGNFLGHAGARYALHRITLDLHGWSISGLEPNETTFNATSLTASGILNDLLPDQIVAIFEGHIGAKGFNLRDLAILAGTIEHLVHQDQAALLLKVCEVLKFPTVGSMSEKDMMTIIRVYKALFLVGFSAGVKLERFTAKIAKKLLQKTHQAYPGWGDTVAFMEDEKLSLEHNERMRSNPFRPRESNLQVALRVVQKVADHFAPHSAEPECQEIKEELLAFERGDSGRIRLADFYRAGLQSRFFFVETKEYLQSIGAIDDTDVVWGPKVIVSNYVLSKCNCLAHNHFYSICCINECEGLYGHIEDAIAAPSATPDTILSVVANMSSSTVQAPRNLSLSLVHRLEEVARGHDGEVRLHSRLFGQWMHQAFPRECPYPHLTGTVTSLNPEEWVKHHGTQYRIDADANASEAAARHVDMLDRELSAMQNASEAPEDDVEDLGMLGMWTFEEEHFVQIKPSLAKRAMSAFGGCVVWMGPLAVFLIVAAAFSNKFLSTVRSDKLATPHAQFV